jgi:hypothetical protein
VNTGAWSPAGGYQEHMFATILGAVTLAAVLLDILLCRESATAPFQTDTLTIDLSRRS